MITRGDYMKIRDSMFGFEIEIKKFNLELKRPKPPAGYVEFNYRKVGPSTGKCPNCGAEKPGTLGLRDGFQDREIQNLSRAMNRLGKRDNQKCSYELFSVDLDPDQGECQTMLKCHPSRYGISEFTCCRAKIWHDFFDDPDAKNISAGWKYYYKPTDLKTLNNWM